MTTKDAKIFLMQIRHTDALINRKIREAQELRERAMNISSPTFGNKVQSSGGHDRLERSVVAFVNLEEQVQQEIEAAAEKKHNILKTLEKLSTHEYEVLSLVYVDGLKLDAVANILGRSRTWCNKTHGSALVNLAKVLDQMNCDQK